jgi:spore coat protein A
VPTPNPERVRVRRLTLNETYDSFGRLIQYLGTDRPINPHATNLLFGREYMADPTEVVRAGETEVWEIANLTGDTHPIHFHLVNVQILSRQPFDATNYTGGRPALLGPATAPDINELGWKETVRMNPGEVTRVIMKFDLPFVPFTVPVSPRTGGHEYVWHCHILEHEEHDMMRPLIVK